MRIGFDAKRAFANKTGLGNYSRFILDALATYQPQHDYLAYTPKTGSGLFPGFPEHSIVLPDTAFSKKLSAYWRYAGITSQLSRERIDIFHGLSNEIPQGLQQAGIASVVTIHDLIFERMPHLFKPVDRMIYHHKFKSACRRADAIVAVSEQTKRDLTELYEIPENRVEVIYQDCNPIFRSAVSIENKDKIKAAYGIEKPFVLSVGTIEERKNQLRLVEAFAALPYADLDLLLIGKKTPYARKIEDFIRSKNLGNRVKILSGIPTDDLPALYQSAEIFAYVSVYEGFGIPVVEALRSGTPVVSAKGSCLEEAGGPGGLYADPYSVEEIAGVLEKLIGDSLLRKKLVVAGQHHVQNFDGANIASALNQLYQEIR